MLKSIIKYSLLFLVTVAMAQSEKESDSMFIKERYGLRLGVDLSKPLRGILEDGYNGLEFVADMRVTKKLYAAVSFGTEEIG
ncbi:MAG: DUF6048 family protein, partial [Flavobacteriaceae bacterium]|nr:DUF6048 family protein [Flavobacteriaceae bacterium]